MSTFADKIKSFFGLTKTDTDGFFDDLCDLLIEGDFGAALAYNTVENLRALCKKEKITDAEKIKEKLKNILVEMLGSVQNETGLSEDTLNVILFLGVNGVGKTTTAAKCAAFLKKSGPAILAACDTFRAAAIDQLKIHGERLDIRVVAHKSGGDPAAVIYDALDAAIAGGYASVIADTAGRMHTKTALVEELKKIDRVVRSKNEKINYRKWIVLDSTTGSNAIEQAETFKTAVAVDGVVLTKLDSTAKGGLVFQLAVTLKLPVLYVCFGEKYEDIKRFNADEYVKEFLG
ncbi:signal recognition particle-docking protein FtsY [Spirochaetia bacterium]|nr:signal recognition particle-docking protein FtsY [Spirochaetia bacterium]